ncbi:hypothetical protein [Microbacterium sp.]|uniref:hypothetical protein n=1 Tax=Microbacterium sp. TaxID=51671 RepID=UPI0028119501|nr:hypothetical protein [Microbacterium sp.]
MLDALRGARRSREHRRAMQELDRRERQLRPGYKVWGYKNVFAKGFLVTRGEAAPPRDTWERATIGPWRAIVDPELERSAATSADAAVLVLGHAFDEGGARTRDRVASRILRAAEASGGVDAQTRAMDAVVTWLSGRYVVLVARGERLDAYADPLAARSIYWHAGASGPALASHTELLSSLAGGLSSERMRWIADNRDYRAPAGRWLPGLITPHDEVGQVYANGRLTVQGDAVSHERFFPSDDRVELSLADAGERFRDELRAQVQNWISIAPLTVLSLTAGRDSRAVLEAGLVELQRARAMTMTYHPFHVASKSTYQDFHAAARLSAAAGLPHLGIDVAAMQPTSQMAGLYRSTFPTWQRYANLANALYLHSPARAATIFGVGGAIITGMWKDTSDRHLTPQLLASKYTSSAFADDPALHAELERWMAFTDFSIDALRGYDFYDFYHWEHRMTKWAGSGYSEYDLATIPAPVLSSRRLLVAALSLPKQQRVDAEVYRYISTDGELGTAPR